MRIATFFLFLGLFLQVQAQMKQPDPTVFIFVGDSIFPMNVITSQTELKKGWDIQGINVGPVSYTHLTLPTIRLV